MATDIRIYRQERDEERWRCDIFPGGGTDHHGVGSTESMALVSAALHWHRYTVVKT